MGNRLSTDIAIIGAGQAGLAAARELSRTSLSFLLLERADRIGTSWRERYDSLRLFSPRRFSQLPGAAMRGDPEGYPSKDETADYLEDYARPLAPRCGEEVVALTRRAGRFVLDTSLQNRIEARAVVVATGAFQKNLIPAFAANLSMAVRQLTATSYRRPSDIAGSKVIVAGDGASGRQIARELAPHHRVALARGGAVHISPQRVAGRDAMWWAEKAGLLFADKDSLRGKLARRFDAFPDRSLTDAALRKAGVECLARITEADGSSLRFEDGAVRQADTVIWCIGYRDEAPWMQIDDAVCEGRLVEDRGVSPVPGLFYIGRSWQNCRASALLCGAGHDARNIVARIIGHLGDSDSERAGCPQSLTPTE